MFLFFVFFSIFFEIHGKGVSYPFSDNKLPRVVVLPQDNEKEPNTFIKEIDLEIGSEIQVVAYYSNRFELETLCSNVLACRPLHISIRPQEDAFVFNSMFQNGLFDIEERRKLVISKLSLFRFNIHIRENGYEVVLNDYWYKFYSHRMDFKLGTQFRVIGFVDVTEYAFFKTPE
ncbi:hypothetical protein CRE_22010 [Caenorhabditis remanei]|uniref:Uncharacterized protein n=1 Tax=Caenorhabditis remanei TaxID=31234 RepID=E3N3C7_CAERE|nr:hypothetical protein CRE_22010 [Caenorhabditis remanei]